MDDELTNLLPLDRLKTLRRRYFLRLFVVAATLFTLLIAASSVLLVPTYVLLKNNAELKERHLASLTDSHLLTNEKELFERLTSLSNSAKILSALSGAPSVGKLIAAVMGAPRPGVTLSGFSYTPALVTPKKAPATLTITGRATTRESLRSFQLALQGVSFVSSASLPVSAYAQSDDISFTITLVLKT